MDGLQKKYPKRCMLAKHLSKKSKISTVEHRPLITRNDMEDLEILMVTNYIIVLDKSVISVSPKYAVFMVVILS